MAKTILDGIRIVDLTTVVFGPYCTLTLAEMGAEVIKLEAPPGGDVFRYSGPWPNQTGMGPGQFTLNRGKKSALLDLKNEEDQQTALDLIKDADVVIHNIRADAIARLGLSYEDVLKVNPNIVYVHCVGFGSDGPYAGLQAYDDVIQAATGTATLAPRVDGDERPRYIPSLIADKVSGLHAVYATLGALYHKQRTGEGQHVEVPMMECFTSFMMIEHMGGLVYDPPNAPAGYPRQVDPNRQPFPTRDGYISIVPYTDDMWGRLLAILGAPDIIETEPFSTAKGRNQNVTKLYRLISELTPNFDSDALIKVLRKANIPCMPVRDLQDIKEDPHLQATDFFTRREHKTEGGYQDMSHPIRYTKTPARKLDPPSQIGENTDQIRSQAKASKIS